MMGLIRAHSTPAGSAPGGGRFHSRWVKLVGRVLSLIVVRDPTLGFGARFSVPAGRYT